MKTYSLILIVSAFMTSAGCSRLAVVEGRATLDEKPLDEAMVTFVKDDGGYDAAGATDADGRFRVEDARGAGVLPGRYRVIVSKIDVPKDGSGNDATNMAAYLRAMANAKELIPAQYTDVSKTPLVIDVPSGGAKDLELKLTSGDAK